VIAATFGYRLLEGVPLVMLVELSRERVLASWRWGAATAAGTTAAILSLVALLPWRAVP